MDLKTYAKEAERTAKDQSDQTLHRLENVILCSEASPSELRSIMDKRASNDLLHGILGMVGEMGELMAAIAQGRLHEIIEECGDFVWYGALVARAMQWDMARYLRKDDFGTFWAGNMVEGVGRLGEILKKWVMYGKPISDKLLMDAWFEAMTAVIHRAGDWDAFENEVLQGNIDKLRKRFPEQFTEKAAIERADKAG